jgi:hypothetical protein
MRDSLAGPHGHLGGELRDVSQLAPSQREFVVGTVVGGTDVARLFVIRG